MSKPREKISIGDLVFFEYQCMTSNGMKKDGKEG